MDYSIAVVLAALLATQDPALAKRALRDLTLDVAFQTARDEDKLVLVAFVRASAPETKVMDQLTWTDPAAVKWIGDHAVAVAVDLEARPELAQRYSITETPAIVFLAATGEELDRMVGVVRPDALLRSGKMLARCGAAVTEARRNLSAAPNDPALHVALAQAYMTCRRSDRARDELLWAWDHGAGEPSFVSYRRELLPYQVAHLDNSDKSGRREIVQRRDELRARLFEWKEGESQLELARDLAALDSGLEADDKALASWETARAHEGAPPEVVEALFTDRLAAHLFRLQRFADLLAGHGDAVVYLDRRLGKVAERVLALQASGGKAEELETERNGALAVASLYFEALCALERLSEARDLVRVITTYDPRTQAYLVLIPCAERTGHADFAAEIGQLALAAAPDAGEKERVRRWLERHHGEAK